MNGVAAVRWGTGAAGVLVGLYGAWLLWDRQTPDQVVTVGTWLLGGVVLHDAAIAAAVLVVGLLVTRVVPQVAKAPVTVGAVVLGSVSLLAVPVLLAYGRKPDNPTLLDRDYGLGWLVFAVLVAVAVAVAVVLRVRTAREMPGEPDGRDEESGD